MQVGKRGRERSDTRGRDLSARDSIHTQYNARIDTRSKPSRTPGYVSHTVLYDAIFLPQGTACPDFNCAGEARATHRKPYYFLAVQPSRMRTREYPVEYRSTNDSVMKSERSSLVRGSDLLKCHIAHTSVGGMWRWAVSRLMKKTFRRWVTH